MGLVVGVGQQHWKAFACGCRSDLAMGKLWSDLEEPGYVSIP